MEPKPGRLVKAVYDFPTDDESELSLVIGDIVQVEERIDKQWSSGISNDRRGNFPIGFTVELKLPAVDDCDELFAVGSDFVAQEEGDLTLRKGDLAVGKVAVDENWWRGEINGNSGIFPLTHVWKINKSALPELSQKKKMSLKAKVKMNLKAQIAEEMDLFKDEVVDIIEEVEKGWYRGECNGRRGIFPATFVTIISEDPPQFSNNSINNFDYDTIPSDNHSGYDCINSGIAPYGRTLYPFRAEFANEMSFKAGEIVNLIRHIDENWIEGKIDGKVGIFPANFVSIVVDCPTSAEKAKENDNANDIDSNVFPPDTYGRVVFDFYPQLEGDVRLKEGDTVTLIRKIDHNWYEVVTDNGETGICPESYIEVIGNGPPSYSEVMGTIIEWTNHDSRKNTNVVDNFSSSLNSSITSQSSSDRNSNVGNNVNNRNSPNLLSPDSSFNSSGISMGSKGSSLSPGFFDSSYENTSKTSDDLDNSFVSNCGDLYQNVADNNQSWSPLSSSDNASKTNSEAYYNVKSIQHTLPSKAPSRPPPPFNTSRTSNNSSFNSAGSSPSLNNARLSLTSVSSHSSSEPERSDPEEIRSLIQNKENKLKIRIACKNKLENEKNQGSINNFVANETETQISQINDEIEHLKFEISDLKLQIRGDVADKENTSPSQEREQEVARKKEAELKRREQEKIKKMREQRDCIITEILQTERDYISDLKLLHELFLQDSAEAKNKGINLPALFGNFEEVVDIASRLLKRLQKVSKETQVIGETFVDMSDEMKEVYGHYCRNHDEVNSMIDKIDPQSTAGIYLKHKTEMLRRQTNCFDLPSMLIKPVQRILKYPLLLNELLKCTEDTHPDKQWLLQATNLMTDVATAVNEFKRQKDLVFKYRKQADTSLSGRISKISLHSMAKKTSRIGMRLTSSIGLKTVIKDEQFEKAERRFASLEKSIKIFQKDINDYVKKAEELVTTAFNVSEEITELYQDRKTEEVEQFRNTHRIILTQHWDSFKITVDRSINQPIKMLLQAYRSPTHLIEKRYDKLLDYESASSKVDKNKDATKIKVLQESASMAKKDYEALNMQLLEDLPKLCDLSVEVLYDCICGFLKAKKNFIGRAAMLMFNLMELPLFLGSEDGGILETFQVKHNLVLQDLSQLSILPREMQAAAMVKGDSSFRRGSSIRGSKLSLSAVSVVANQTQSQKSKVRSSYGQNDLYTACQNFNAADLMDINLKKGDLVGVIKQQDPMGKKQRWFVDNGETKGFVPAKCLIKFLPSASSPLNQSTSDWNIVPSPPVVNQRPTDTYAKPQKQSPSPQPSPILQPVRPAPVVAPSLRNVAPSKYPSKAQDNRTLPRTSSQDSRMPPQTSSQNKPISSTPYPLRNAPTLHKSNTLPSGSVSQTTSRNRYSADVGNISLGGAVESDPIHRYEEICELSNIMQPVVDLMDVSSASSNQKPGNVIDEFDPYSTVKRVPEIYDNVPECSENLYSTHRYEDIPDEQSYDQVSSEPLQQAIPEYYYGLYDFAPSGPNQLVLNKGQVVLVLHKCDLNQNEDWWFVENRFGNKGYVPAIYLNKYSQNAA